MSEWDVVLNKVRGIVADLRRQECIDPFFRGQADSNWSLLPSLGRGKRGRRPSDVLENRLFHRFRSLGGQLLTDAEPNWSLLFLMRQHGLPTRLLDWTENFAVALVWRQPNVDHVGS